MGHRRDRAKMGRSLQEACPDSADSRSGTKYQLSTHRTEAFLRLCHILSWAV